MTIRGQGIALIGQPWQAADYLGIHNATVVRKTRAGTIPGFQIGSHWRYRKADLEAWVDSRVREPDGVINVSPSLLRRTL